MGHEQVTHSDQDNDWLGPGAYFWEGDPTRALEWADAKVRQKRYARPFVVGAVIDLGNCLDLVARDNIDLLAFAYDSLKQKMQTIGAPMPKNEDAAWDQAGDKLKRFLDCAVIRHLHFIIEDNIKTAGSSAPIARFDTVRGLFTEGGEAYDGGRFMKKSHTQIAVRESSCIKGYFIPPGSEFPRLDL